jgi:hypothetical protein
MVPTTQTSILYNLRTYKKNNFNVPNRETVIPNKKNIEINNTIFPPILFFSFNILEKYNNGIKIASDDNS